MITHRQLRRREIPTGNRFSLAKPVPRGRDDHDSFLGDMEHASPAERTTGKLGGTPSQPLWKTMESPMARSADSSPMHKHHNGKQVVPNPGARDIARYRQDMLDMVREMPESAYELTLRDMVETPRIAQTVQETIEKRREEANDKAEKVKDQSKGKRRLLRKESMETGVFLRMFVPISLGGGRRKSSGGSNTCAKVSPRPVLAEAEKGGIERMKGELWKKNDSDGKGSRSRKMNGCYDFFLTNKSRSM
ncbi:uncharacterized protein LOC135651227 [Musa acuminata AAA Group]|uniref:uncharacterized protein LOC135651227 n=1 Tax=Musa acuminata AAA Group TaxID=214697 RepID=UPI0031DBB83A